MVFYSKIKSKSFSSSIIDTDQIFIEQTRRFEYRNGLIIHNFRPKKYHFLLLLPFDAETFKTCKNTIKLINSCALPCLGLGLWLTLTVYFDLA